MAAAAGAPPPGPPQPPPPPPPEESSDSEPEAEPGSPQKLIRKVSTSGQIRQKTILKEGMLAFLMVLFLLLETGSPMPVGNSFGVLNIPTQLPLREYFS